MSPSGSETPIIRAAAGFSLIEVLVTLVIATVLGAGVTKFYRDSYRTYSVQEQVSERNQNAHFVVTRFSDILQQSGSVLPDTGWTVISFKSGALVVGVNPRGAEQFNGVAATSSNFIPVTDATKFANTANVLLNTSHVLVDYALPGKGTDSLVIDANHNLNGFVNGVKNNATGLDSIRVKTAVALSVGDRIFGYREDHYLVTGGNLVVRPNGSAAAQMVLAESIDSLGFTFRDAAGLATTNWKFMRSASFTVRARTAKADSHLKTGSGYRMITLPMNVILRNKI